MKRGIMLSLVMYIVSIIVGIVIVILFDKNLSQANAELNNWIVSVVISVILAIPFGKWYFDSNRVTATHIEGAKLGVVFLLTGLLIDFVLAIPFMIQNSISAFTRFYTDSFFFVYVLVIILTTTFVGSYWEKRSKE